MSNLQQVIEAAFEKRAEITPKTVDAQTRAAIEEVIEGLDSGKYRVAEKIDGEWVTHQWLKKAVLLSFRINDNKIIDGAETKYYDKVALNLLTIQKSVLLRKVSVSYLLQPYVKVHISLKTVY